MLVFMLWELLQPIAFKKPAHLVVVSYTINVAVKLACVLSLLAAGFGSCSPFMQRTVIYESTPK